MTDARISFALPLIPHIRAGRKTLTYRAGCSPLQEGDLALITGTGIWIRITGRWQERFGSLALDDPRHEPYGNVTEKRRVFAEYYGREIGDDEEMTVLAFQVERTDD